MDLVKRAKLIAKIMKQFDQGVEYPLVSAKAYFDGNTDEQSLAPNLCDDHPGLEKFAAVLRNISKREDVAEVLVSILECPEVDEEADEDMWPAGEYVHIITSASVKTVKEWVSDLRCTSVTAGWPQGKPAILPKLPDGYRVRTLFWD